MFEDDPKAHDWDRHGRYYPKLKHNTFSNSSILDEVIDYGQKNIAKKQREIWKRYYEKNKEKILVKQRIRQQDERLQRIKQENAK